MVMIGKLVAQVANITESLVDETSNISLAGLPKRLGGDGRCRFVCDCSFYKKNIRSCKHIKDLKKKVKTSSISLDPRYSITNFGKQVFKIH